MSTEVILPKIGFSMNEGILSEWLVLDGATVNKGQLLFSIESDKSTNEVDSPASGVIRITGVAGETYEVGTVIATID